MRQSTVHRDVGRLLVGTAAMAVMWGMILPRLLAVGPVARHVRLMEDRGVDPAAMYYTELERLPLRPEWIEDRLVLWP
ncbi:MAG: hypothetical protein ACKOEX_00890 [Planctomycetia bacterium]